MSNIETDKQKARERIEKLRKIIRRERYLYHVLNKPNLSDGALDSLKKELFDLENTYPELITADSPTQRVAGKALSGFQKARHLQPMYSINDAFNRKDFQDWEKRNRNFLKKDVKGNYYTELKFDGLAVELYYENFIFQRALTRGDGLVGEDVTGNVKTIGSIPLRLREIPHLPSSLVVRGEILIFKKELERINRERKKKGLRVFANSRNLAAGSIRQLDPSIPAKRKLEFFAYALLENNIETHEREIKTLSQIGFKTSPLYQTCSNEDEVFSFFAEVEKKRSSLPFGIDGIVIYVNSKSTFQELGVSGKSPRGILALKFPAQTATTILKDIRVQVGRTGVLTPVAILQPVNVGGVLVSKATLHNQDEIKRLGLLIGDTVVVQRAGDVIPDIVKVLPEMRDGSERSFHFPKLCPNCSTVIQKKEGQVAYFCPNRNCSAVRRRFLQHAVSRKAFNIEGLGSRIVDRLIEKGLVNNLSDFFSLQKGDFLSLEGFQEKLADKIKKEIDRKKIISLPRFIFALGIRGVGEETARDLAEKFKNIESISQASQEKIESIPNVGPIVAHSIFSWFQKKENVLLLKNLKQNGVNVISFKKKKNDLEGKTFIFTGSLKSMDRSMAKELVHELGGKTRQSMSSRIDFLVMGQNPGSKLKQAKKMGIEIMTEENFLEIIKNVKKD